MNNEVHTTEADNVEAHGDETVLSYENHQDVTGNQIGVAGHAEEAVHEEILIENGQPVEFGQPLLKIKKT